MWAFVFLRAAITAQWNSRQVQGKGCIWTVVDSSARTWRRQADAEKRSGDTPRQQLIDPVDGMVGDVSEDVVQISLWIDAVEFCCLCRAPNYAEWTRVQSRSSVIRM